MKALVTAVRPGGALVIAHSAREGHYCRLHHRMCDAAEARGSTAALWRAIAAEDIAEALRDQDVQFKTAEVGYTTCMPSREDDESLLVEYIQVGCACSMDGPPFGLLVSRAECSREASKFGMGCLALASSREEHGLNSLVLVPWCHRAARGWAVGKGSSVSTR